MSFNILLRHRLRFEMKIKTLDPYKYLILWVICSSILTSCRVTQPYSRPDNMIKGVYRGTSGSDTSNLAEIPWRQLFKDTLLQNLIDEGIHNNLDMKIAMARIDAAQANFQQSKAAFYPSLSANATSSSQKLAETQGGQKHYYETYLGSSWEVGLWGKLRSARRSSLALLLQSYAYKRAVQTQLVSDITTNYYALLGLDAQLEITNQTIENRKEDVETMKVLKQSDVVTGAAVVQSSANQYSVAVTVPDLRQEIWATENTISILLGRNPGPVIRGKLGDTDVSEDMKAGMPLQLLSYRPDVQEAEYQFRSNTELANVAKTNFYPALTITASGGLYSTNIGQVVNPAAFFGNIIGGLMQPIYNNGINQQRLKVAQAQQQESFQNFKQSLLTASQEVSNALYSYQTATDKIALRSQQIEYLRKSVEYTKELLKYTANTNYTDVLTSEQSLLSSELNSVNDRLQQLQAVVSLYRSLGGGWK